MNDVHLLTLLPDGTAIGFDDAEPPNTYRGTPTEIPYNEMTVTTVMADDGESFTRAVSLPDGSTHGQGTVSKETFIQSWKGNQFSATGQLPTDAEAEAEWEAQCAIDSLDDAGKPALVYTWVEI